ncbi:nucleotide-diphospho-sugar transferase [Polychytrium aggregatum]|uniref:nucleotide-diphospho-sugar transferase n=1 Tax=Polychytrium aggregatum TaxID=110093 RepID=UPI0022FF11AD|nr:nucleotide-diphospho-sugar transferase [Polychytrium aggregatum]KAI9208644.1 nucleotide-diphospho-sugar transferase [Polychytrium aggregatum]
MMRAPCRWPPALVVPMLVAACLFVYSLARFQASNPYIDPIFDQRQDVTIPSIIHQSWKNETLPKRFQKWSDSWKRHHPTWTYILWTDDMNRKLIETSFPWFLDTYDALPKNINRADASRYFYMYKYGGVYADLDMECLRAMDAPVVEGGPALIERGSALISFMGLDTQFEHSLPNAWMASAPGHPFWMFVVDEIMRAVARSTTLTAEEATGPVVLYKAWMRFRSFPTAKRSGLTVLKHGYIYPYNWNYKNSAEAFIYPDNWLDVKYLYSICSAQSDQIDEELCKKKLGAEGKPGQLAYTITYWSHVWEPAKSNKQVLDQKAAHAR